MVDATAALVAWASSSKTSFSAHEGSRDEEIFRYLRSGGFLLWGFAIVCWGIAQLVERLVRKKFGRLWTQEVLCGRNATSSSN